MHPQAAPEGQPDQRGKPDGEHGQKRNSSPVQPHCGRSGCLYRLGGGIGRRLDESAVGDAQFLRGDCRDGVGLGAVCDSDDFAAAKARVIRA